MSFSTWRDMFLGSGHKALTLLLACLILLTLGTADSELSSTTVYSDKIDPVLVEKFAQSKTDQRLPVELIVADTLTAATLARFLDSAYFTLEDKRRAGLRILRQRTADAQRDLLVYLDRLEQSGRVANIESDWLTNSIIVEVSAEVADSIARRDDIQSMSQLPTVAQVIPENPTRRATVSAATGGVESNLSVIGADSAWHMGYTGKGRVICVFDYTGVDGHHPAIAANWKGLDGDSAAAWNDSRGQIDFFPHINPIWDDSYHGTSMVGIVVGHDDVLGDTVGVAPDAKWIAATWYRWGWAADPDGDPNTTADMPDVINLSAGNNMSPCLDIYSEEIDMVEALGIVVVIAAGNGGWAPYTTWSPANRAVDSLTNFAVGSVDHLTGLVRWSSSRGPSPCDSVSIKPNVTAPGAWIRCAIPGGGYEYHGGTSMATPHVTGAVAILRQYAPDATVRQIKEALLAGATPSGDGHPNNDYGWGIVNIPRSMAFLSRTFRPVLRVAEFAYSPTDVEDTLIAAVSILNRGYEADSVYLKFDGHFPGLTVLTDSIYFGEIAYSTERFGDISFRCIFDDTLLGGPTIPVTYTIHSKGGYVDTVTAKIVAGVRGSNRECWIAADRFTLNLTNYGYLALIQSLMTDSYPEDYDSIVPAMYLSGSLLIAVDSARVSDHFHAPYANDNDFWVDTQHPLVVSEPGEIADKQTDCTFNDGLAENQIGIEVRQQSYSWATLADNNYLILEYQISNPTPKHQKGVYVGLVFELSEYGYMAPPCLNADSQVFSSGSAKSDRLGYLIVRPCSLDTTRYIGLAVLNNDGEWSHRVAVLPDYPTPGLSESEKYQAMTGGVVGAGLTASTRQGLMQYVSTGPFSLDPWQSDTLAFAVIVGNSVDELRSANQRAHERWTQISPSQNLPQSFALRQNYPNPFNSSTNIEFDLPVGGKTRLTIYNVLGQTVRTLVDDMMTPGSHRVSWDGTNGSGKWVASGVYFYRLTTEHTSESKKMLLLK